MNAVNLQKIINLRHLLHTCPELSMQEHHTKEVLMDFLRRETALEVADGGSWFYACYHCMEAPGMEASCIEASGMETPCMEATLKRPIAFRADFDALPIEETLDLPYASQNPGVSHKCGHDGHSAALVGLALEVDEKGADRDVYFIFQHGEEIGGGGELCSSIIWEKGISQVYAFHNWSGFPLNSIVVKEGTCQCASKGLTVYLEGKPSHASQPEDGTNPARALSCLMMDLTAGACGGCGDTEREDTESEDMERGNMESEDTECGDMEHEGMVLATIVHVAAGNREAGTCVKDFGISAWYGELSVTLRAEREQDLKKLETRIRQRAGELAEAEKLKVSFAECDIFPETVNSADGVERVKQAAKNCGFPIIELEKPIRASEDFGYYLKQCPGAMFYIGNGETYPELHTSEYDFNDAVLETAVGMFWELVKIS